MKKVPSYTKVLTLGSSYTENALVGRVTVQEKVDGSQFGFGIDEDRNVVMRSKGAELFVEEHAKMFSKAVEYVSKLDYTPFKAETYFYCEYLEKPKHNTLKYDRVPKNHLVLFDALVQGKWISRETLEEFAKLLDIEVIPRVHVGEITVEGVKELLNKESFLGGVEAEGVVIKNYSQTITLGGNVYPLITKYVTERFKEQHSVDWTTRNPSSKKTLQDHILAFKSEARWEKAIIHAREQGTLTNSPKDIGMLMQMVQQDMEMEHKEDIKQFLWSTYKKDYMKTAIHGLPEWYKNRLLENLNVGE